jgi:HEPN domain-containing protein
VSPVKKEEILKWFEKADNDIITAKKSIDCPPIVLDSACFHCQQAIEKYLKAYILYQGKDIKKTHNINFLKDTCTEYDPDFENFDFKELSVFAVDIRYPDDSLVPTLDEAKEYIQLAEEIKELVLKKVIFTLNP